jgi:hypothetical protein
VSETHVVAAITEYLLYRDALVIRINSGAVQPTAAGSRYVPFNRWQALGLPSQTAGVSDLMAIIPSQSGSKVIFLECKLPGKRHKSTPAQKRFLYEVRARGGIAGVVTSIEDVEQLLQGIL